MKEVKADTTVDWKEDVGDEARRAEGAPNNTAEA